MAELDDQLARLAAHRSDAVPALDPAAARVRARRNSRRRAAAFSALAACIAALLVVGGLALFGGSDDGPSVHAPAASTAVPPTPSGPPTTVAPTTSTPPTCPPLDGADDLAKQGAASANAGLETPTVVNLQVQTGACVDAVRISVGPTPSWSAHYETTPDGVTRLVISFGRAELVGYFQIPSDLVAGPPSAISGVRQTSEPGGSITWTFEMTERLPFRVVMGEGVIDVEVASAQPRVLTCTVLEDHVEYLVPDGWVLGVAPGHCGAFAPEPYVSCSACDGPFSYGTVVLSEDFNADLGEWSTLISSTTAVVGGRPATVREIEATGMGLFPAGYRTYEYLVDWSPDGTLVISIGGVPSPEFDARKAGLDAIASSARYIG